MGEQPPGSADLWRFQAGGLQALGEASLAPQTEGAGSEDKSESAATGLVSSGYFLASEPQVAGLGEAASRAAFCFSSYSWELKVLTFQGLNPASSSMILCEQVFFYPSYACVLKGICYEKFCAINIKLIRPFCLPYSSPVRVHVVPK